MRAVDRSSGLIARYVDARQQEAAANATINRELAALKRMFRLAQQATPPKVLRTPAFPKLAENNARTGVLTDTQRDALAAQCAMVGLWLRTMYEVGCTYGWRVSEVKGLLVRHVDIGAHTIRLDPGTTKNGQGRVVTFEAQSTLCELLAACVHGKSADDSVITREDGKPVRDFRDTWAKVCKAAGVPGLLFHDLRRTAARNLRRAGVAENIIMQIGGWRTRSVFDRYAIITENDIVDAVRKLEADRKQREAVALEVAGISHEIDPSTDLGCKRKAAKLSRITTVRLGRDGGTGRRSGLKIRRGLSPRGGSTPPPGTSPKPLVSLSSWRSFTARDAGVFAEISSCRRPLIRDLVPHSAAVQFRPALLAAFKAVSAIA